MKSTVAVLGGGISGLATAFYLQNHGIKPVVFESTADLGGLGSVFRHRGIPIERFYHVMVNSDRQMMSLLRDLNLLDMVRWTKTGMGFYVDGQAYPFNKAMDLLRFDALSLSSRLRTGAAALALSAISDGAHLDGVPVDQFLRDYFGNAAFDKIWQPLLRAKFGEFYTQVPAYWFWNRMRREKGRRPEVKGYMKGGYRGVVNALELAITSRGGEVRRSTGVSQLLDNGSGVTIRAAGEQLQFDAVVSTLPFPLLRNIAPESLLNRASLPDLTYQGVVNVAIVSREPLQQHYWTAVLDRRFPFQGLVETTRVIPSRWMQGRHIIYAMNYCQPGSEPYERHDELLQWQALRGIKALYPGFNLNSVEGAYVFRAPHVEPVWPVGYLKQKPPTHIPGSSTYLCTTAHSYPDTNSWNTSIGLAKGVARQVANNVKRSTSVGEMVMAISGRA